MKKLIKQNYDSIVQRGLITVDTTTIEFLDKMDEEVMEFCEAIIDNNEEAIEEECADVILTMLNFAYHKGIDIEQVMKDKIKKNFKR